MEMKGFNEKIIEEFRANAGKVAMFADYPMVILHTIGAKSGKIHLVPLVLTVNADDEMLLFASFAGAKTHPAWVFNLRSNPEITVEFGTEQYTANVIELSEEDAKRAVQIQAGITEQFAEYVKSAAPRDIPVFRIERV